MANFITLATRVVAILRNPVLKAINAFEDACERTFGSAFELGGCPVVGEVATPAFFAAFKVSFLAQDADYLGWEDNLLIEAAFMAPVQEQEEIATLFLLLVAQEEERLEDLEAADEAKLFTRHDCVDGRCRVCFPHKHLWGRQGKRQAADKVRSRALRAARREAAEAETLVEDSRFWLADEKAAFGLALDQASDTLRSLQKEFRSFYWTQEGRLALVEKLKGDILA